MSNQTLDILTAVGHFLFPFAFLAAVFYIIKRVIQKFHFFKASAKILWQQFEVEAGSYPKPKARPCGNELTEGDHRLLPNAPAPPHLLPSNAEKESKSVPDL